MSFSVALQSAIFYFVACTPCTKVRHRTKARQQAKKDREKHAIEAQNPDIYQHPSPFHTNPFWEEEIAMGPRLPKKGKGGDSAAKSASQRGLTSAGHDSDVATRSSLAISTRYQADAMPSAAHSPAATPGLGSAPTVVPEEDGGSVALSKTASVSTGDDWNRKRYQREDEELWGHELSRTGQKLMDAIKQAGTSAGRFVEAKLGKEKPPVTDEDRHNFYQSPRNPPVNDYHPPVVSSKPAHRDGHRWMLQPPPPAKVMEGKVPVSRSASMASMASRRTMASSGDGPLARLVGERAVEAKLRKGEMPAKTGSNPSSLSRQHANARPPPGPSRPKSQRAAGSRSLSLSTDSDGSSDDETSHKRRPKGRRPALAPPLAIDDGDDDSKPRSHPSATPPTAHAAQRPRLSTIRHSDATEQPENPVNMPSGPLPKAVEERQLVMSVG